MTRIKIEGMSCQHCVNAVTQALSDLDGISDVKVSLETMDAVFESTGQVDMKTIRKAVEDQGYKVAD